MAARRAGRQLSEGVFWSCAARPPLTSQEKQLMVGGRSHRDTSRGRGITVPMGKVQGELSLLFSAETVQVSEYTEVLHGRSGQRSGPGKISHSEALRAGRMVVGTVLLWCGGSSLLC